MRFTDGQKPHYCVTCVFKAIHCDRSVSTCKQHHPKGVNTPTFVQHPWLSLLITLPRNSVFWKCDTLRHSSSDPALSSTPPANYDDIGHKPYRPQTKSATDHIGHSLYHIGHKRSTYRPQTTSTIDNRLTHSTNAL